MKIKNVNVDGFGVWKGLHIDSVSDNMTVFFGRNEAGKTTLMQFIRSSLYGFSEERRSRYLPPIHGGMGGGTMLVDSNHGEVSITRHVDPGRIHSEEGDLSMTWEDGRVTGGAQLAMLISSIDEATFNNVFAIGLREIQELAMLDNTDAAEQLYRLTSGLDRVSLVDVMKSLKGEREAIWTVEKGKKSRITVLQTEQKKLRREIDELVSKSRRWSKVGMQSSELEHHLTRLGEQITVSERSARVVETALQIRERWNARQLIHDQVKSIGKLPDERDVSTKMLDEMNSQISDVRANIENNRVQREQVSSQAKSLPINRLLWKNASRIDALQEHGPWIDSLERQIHRKKTGLKKVKADLGDHVSNLSSQFKSNGGEIPEIAPQAIDSLRSIARSLKEEKKKFADAKQIHADALTECTVTEDELRTELEKRGCDRLVDSLDDSNKLIGRLRRRVEVNEHIEELDLKRKEVEHDIESVMREQVMPPRRIFWLGVVVVLGISLVAIALLKIGNFSQDTYGYMIALGIICGIFAACLKFTWDQHHRDELENQQHQLDIVRQQIKRSITERNDLDSELPDGIFHHDTKLRDTETELMRLQDLVPLEARLKSVRKAVEESERHVSSRKENVSSVIRKWKSKLRSVGLPESLSPNSVREIAARTDRINSINGKLHDYRDDLLHREQELVAISERVRLLVNEVGIKADSKEPKSQLLFLSDSLADQRKLIERRKEYAVDYRKLRSRSMKLERQLDTLLGAKTRMLSKVGAESEEEFREFSMKHDQLRQLIEKRQALDEQISAAIGMQVTEDQVAAELDSHGSTALEKRWESLQTEMEQFLEQRSKLHQQRGEFLQEMKTLAEDRRIDEARLELNMVDQKIKEAIEQWQVIATTCLLLESIRESYEAERQPETLNEASEFLSDLTGGKYVRIWTKLTENILIIDNAEGESLAVEVLSRGTREAVYLALRMALIAAYARRGIQIPMVLDDVLVNFDAQRAHNAGIALKEFSKRGYQVLMFTCHDHIRELFLRLETDVFDLPSHIDVIERNATVTRAHLVQPEIPVVTYEPSYEEPPTPTVSPVVQEPVAAINAPRPTLFVDGHETELQRLSRELKEELNAIPTQQADFELPGASRLSSHSELNYEPYSELESGQAMDSVENLALPELLREISITQDVQDSWQDEGAA